MFPHALSATIALALAIPGGVFAVDAVNDDAVPGLDAGSYLRAHAPGFAARGHDGHDKGHAHAHDGAHDGAHDKAHDRNHTAHDGPGHQQGHAFHDHRGAPGVHMVARCLASDNRSDEECIQLAGRIANDTVDAVADCMASDEPRDCQRGDGKNGHHAHHARIAHCIENQGKEPCAEILATHLLCHGARMAGVEAPIECPERHHDKHDGATTSDDSTYGTDSTDSADDSDDAQTSSNGA